MTLRCKGDVSLREQAERLKTCLGRADDGTDAPGMIRNMDAAGDAVSFFYSGEPSLLLKGQGGNTQKRRKERSAQPQNIAAFHAEKADKFPEIYPSRKAPSTAGIWRRE